MAIYINENNEYYNGHSIEYDGHVIINPTVEILIEAGYHEVITPEPTAEQLLVEAKESKLGDIISYDNSSAVNEFYLGSIPMWLDAPTRQQLRISIEAYQAIGETEVTKWFMGEEFTFTISIWFQMLNALEVYASEALNVTESHKAAVNALTTIEEVEDYDITAGYPTKLNLMPR